MPSGARVEGNSVLLPNGEVLVQGGSRVDNDGPDRVNCLRQPLDKLNKGGVIVLDDSQRDAIRKGSHILSAGDSSGWNSKD